MGRKLLDISERKIKKIAIPVLAFIKILELKAGIYGVKREQGFRSRKKHIFIINFLVLEFRMWSQYSLITLEFKKQGIHALSNYGKYHELGIMPKTIICIQESIKGGERKRGG